MKEKIIGLYPMTKFIFIICYMVIGLFIPSIVGRLIWFACLNVIVIMSGTFKDFFKSVYGGVGTVAILMLLMQGLFYPGEKVVLELGAFAFKEEGLLYSVKLSLLLFIIVGAFIWYFEVTTHKEFIYALEDAGLPPKASFVVLATLQMIPVLQKKSATIMNAQRARGVETEGNLWVRMKVFIPTLGPLVLSSIASTEERALTMEARGFSAPVKKTHLYTLEKRTVDKVIEKVIIVGTVLFIVWRIVSWLW